LMSSLHTTTTTSPFIPVVRTGICFSSSSLIILPYFYYSFYSDVFLPTHCRCRQLLLHLITHNGTYTFGGTPLDEGSASCICLCPYST
jgi:hypothetical protein